MHRLGRRQFLIGGAIVAGSAALSGRAGPAAAATPPLPGGKSDAVGDTYIRRC